MLWILLENGTLACATILQGEVGKIYAWNQHILGGNQAKVLNFATSYNRQSQWLWLQVDRKINQKSQIFLEAIEFKDFEDLYNFSPNDSTDTTNSVNFYYLDAYFTTNLHNNQLNDLSNYNGDQFEIISQDNNLYFGSYKILDNQVIFTHNKYNDQKVICGYNFKAIYQSKPLEESHSYNTLGLDKKVESVTLSLRDTKQLFLSNDIPDPYLKESTLKEISFLTDAKSYNHQSFSFNVDFPWHSSPTVTLIQYKPFNLNILSIKARVLLKNS
ncbi:hypothetical protein ABSA28_00964 [Candidatus Hepatincolaceae symbiont of Richtersius coronifer]